MQDVTKPVGFPPFYGL